MKTSQLFILIAVACSLFSALPAETCTGITLKSKDGATLMVRTIEWGADYLKSQYVVVPRGYTAQSYTPDEQKNGMNFTVRYGYQILNSFDIPIRIVFPKGEVPADIPNSATQWTSATDIQNNIIYLRTIDFPPYVIRLNQWM